MKKNISILLFVVLATASFAGSFLNITILHTNDLHGNLLAHDYAGQMFGSSAMKDTGGLARRATMISRIKRNTFGRSVFVIDGGDVFTRGPWHKKWYGEPEITAMNMMKYDMSCVGNNEFKGKDGIESQEVLLGLIKKSNFPWLAANWTDANGNMLPGVKPYIIKDIRGTRVAFLGLTAPRSKDYPQTKGWVISDPIATAKKIMPNLKKEADIIIAVTHIGYDLDKQLAAEVPGINAIVGADSHTFIYMPTEIKLPDGRIVPIVQAGENGIMLGQFNLDFEKKDKEWQLKKFNGKLIPLDKSIPQNPEIYNMLRKYVEKVAEIFFERWAA
jgi:2',3'-cyclic-nucleotide 2'-phosphodiesterase (5'-nucleotidase family)